MRAVARDLAITFAGGGNRAFYQLGLMNRWGPRLMDRVGAVASVSAGSCVIVMYLTGRQEEASEFWRARRAHVTRNFEWRRMLRGQRPAPHGEVLRDTMMFVLGEGGLARVRDAPFPVHILTSRFPPLVPSGIAVAGGIGAYQLEKRMRKRMVHPRFGRALGFRPLAIDARACETAEELTTLILASSATPPFTPVGRFRGERLLDGGLVDNVPAFIINGAPGILRNLVLLTRPYPHESVGRRGDRLYIAPSGPVPISRWDYTRPELLDETIRMGEREADLYAPLLDEFLTGSD